VSRQLRRRALHRTQEADAEWLVESFDGRMRDEILNEKLFLVLDDARAKIAARVSDFNTVGASACDHLLHDRRTKIKVMLTLVIPDDGAPLKRDEGAPRERNDGAPRFRDDPAPL